MRFQGNWTSRLKGRYPESEVFDFHNYPIGRQPLQGQDETIQVDPEDWKKFRTREKPRSLEEPYQYVEFEMSGVRSTTIEIPAIYSEDVHPEIWNAMENDDPMKNLDQISYLREVDLDISQEELGVLDPDVPEIIADGIEEVLEETG